MTQTGLSLGTPQNVSPEQAMGEKVIDLRSDIYALGAVTHEMLVGEAPFTGPSVQAIVARVLTEEPCNIALQRKAVPEAVERAVLRALEKLSADRFASASEFTAALQEGTTGQRSAASRRTPRASASNTRAFAAGAAMLVFGIAAGRCALQRSSAERTRRSPVARARRDTMRRSKGTSTPSRRHRVRPPRPMAASSRALQTP